MSFLVNIIILVSLTYINREGFLSRVLSSIGSSDDGVSYAAVELLTYIVYNFTKNNYQVSSSYIKYSKYND